MTTAQLGRLCWNAMDNPHASETAETAAVPASDAPSAAEPGVATAQELNAQLGALLGQIADGDRAAFADFYRLTSRRVFGMARRVLVDLELSEDATQEVFLQVWQNAASFMADGRLDPHQTDREARYGADSQEIDHDSVSDEVGSRLEAEAVVRCLKTLTETQQESVRLAYYGGLSYREVAEQLNSALPTIKSRIRDGLIRLKTCLEVS